MSTLAHAHTHTHTHPNTYKQNSHNSNTVKTDHTHGHTQPHKQRKEIKLGSQNQFIASVIIHQKDRIHEYVKDLITKALRHKKHSQWQIQVMTKLYIQ